MKYKIVYSPESREDLVSIVTYIRDELLAPSSAENVLKKLQAAIKSLDEFPLRCSLYEHPKWKSLGLRYLPVDNYVIETSYGENISYPLWKKRL